MPAEPALIARHLQRSFGSGDAAVARSATYPWSSTRGMCSS